jgi:cobalamin biosynthesis Mg chelatase CobN
VEIQERSDPPAHSSNTDGGGSGSARDGSDGQAGSGAGSKGKSSEPGSGAQGSKGSGGGTHQGGQGDASGGAQSGLEGTTAAAVSGEDSSSPLIPILIAIAILAAISIGAVLMRQRRRSDDEPGLPASPKAS